jgi:excisionase family DNA binding protein
MGTTRPSRNLFDRSENLRPLTAAERRAIEAADYLTPAEAAVLLRTVPSTIYRHIEDGTLPAIRLGPRFIRIKRSDLDALRQTRGAT